MLERLAERLMEPLDIVEFAQASVMWNQALGGILGLMRVEMRGIAVIATGTNDALQVGDQLGALFIGDACLLVFEQCASPSDSLESGSNPQISSHGHSGVELTRLPLSARTSKQKNNCSASCLAAEHD